MRPFLVGLYLLAACDSKSSLLDDPPLCLGPVPLTAAEVETMIARAAARADEDGNAYTITVVNRDGVVVGAFRMASGAVGFDASCRAKAVRHAWASNSTSSSHPGPTDTHLRTHCPNGNRRGIALDRLRNRCREGSLPSFRGAREKSTPISMRQRNLLIDEYPDS